MAMFCTKCGTELRQQDNFCFNCGAATANGASMPRSTPPLSRPMNQAKIAGVCAGFARHLGWDVTLVRVLWVILSFWPLPLFGVIGYIVAWIALPKDPVTTVQVHTVTS
jgi:phage shock protein C